MQQTDVVRAVWYSREALVSIVGPTFSIIGCQRWRQSCRPVTVLVGDLAFSQITQFQHLRQ
jgi:hypothetical protein